LERVHCLRKRWQTNRGGPKDDPRHEEPRGHGFLPRRSQSFFLLSRLRVQPMTSYSGRRKRWQRRVCGFDGSAAVSDNIQVDMLLEQAGSLTSSSRWFSRQQRTCTTSRKCRGAEGAPQQVAWKGAAGYGRRHFNSELTGNRSAQPFNLRRWC